MLHQQEADCSPLIWRLMCVLDVQPCVTLRREYLDERSNVGTWSDGQRGNNRERFDNLTVIVTGGARGTGASHARGFVAEGANV